MTVSSPQDNIPPINGVPEVKQKYGRLTVICEVEPRIYPYGSYKMLKLLCDCGNEVIKRASKVYSGYTKSCGCILKEKRKEINYVHGGRKDLLYVVWSGMKQRCLYSKAMNYKYYGGRGIKISDEWYEYINFKKDMEPTYIKGLTLDRIDVNKHYCKENCRWVTPKEQANNRRKRTKKYANTD